MGKILIGCKKNILYHDTEVATLEGERKSMVLSRRGWPLRHSGSGEWFGLYSKSNGKPLQGLIRTWDLIHDFKGPIWLLCGAWIEG